MSHPANYLIRENGKLRLFYAPWGARTVAEDMFWGPEFAHRFILQLQPVSPNQLLDDLWGEGGVALDFDTKVITLFGDDGMLCAAGEVHPGFLELMREVWASAGWRVEWASAGMPAIASAVGLDPSIAISSPQPPTPVPLAEIGRRLRDGKLAARTLVSIVDSETQHRVSDINAAGMLANGPALLKVLEDLPRLEDYLLRWKPTQIDGYEWHIGDDLTSSIIVWPSEKRILFREFTGDISVIGFLEAHWPDWSMRRFYGGLNTHSKMIENPAEESPKSVALKIIPNLPENDDSIDEIASILLAPEPEEIMMMLSDSEATEESDEPVLPDLEIRQQIFSKALGALYAKRLSVPG